ncbi:MAG: DNA-directed RNA polymerase subunit omega [Planctomycetota bacterium]|jgi:DNA-directed RNA polymerase subunit omega
MIEELKNTEIVNKVGGRFKLSALIQKRMIELMEGSRPLIEDTEGMSPMEIVVQEIKQETNRKHPQQRCCNKSCPNRLNN